MNAWKLSEAVRFLENLLFWVQCPDPNGHTKQDSWRHATLLRMEELLVDHVDYRLISPKVRKLIHTLNGNPLPEFLRSPFVEVEKIRDELQKELGKLQHGDVKSQKNDMQICTSTDMVTIPKHELQKLTKLTYQGMTKRYKNGEKWGYFNITDSTVDMTKAALQALKNSESFRT